MEMSKNIFVLLLLVGVVFGSERPIEPMEQVSIAKPLQAEIGRVIFDATSISESGAISCRSCHKRAYGGADNVAVSYGMGCINSPSIYNLESNYALNWNGVKKSIEEHIGGPLKNLMKSSPAKIVEFIMRDSRLKAQFLKAYTEVNKKTVMDALAKYVYVLKTKDSRFDKYLRGEKNAIDATEERGYRKFVDFGCTSCHNGMNVGGNTFMKIGIFEDATTQFNPECSKGRYDYTKKDEDMFVFRVPSLRNVTKTAPYFHDGSIKTLKDAINLMARFQLGHPLKKDDVEDIVAFLGTLEADIDE